MLPEQRPPVPPAGDQRHLGGRRKGKQSENGGVEREKKRQELCEEYVNPQEKR